jgi:RNA polymerase sigma factor (TIGR02999 family)
MENDVLRLLQECKAGRKDSLDKLLPIVYDELRRMAHRLLRNEYAETLPTTALVHEAYLKLVNQHSVDWENLGQFFGVASQAMRRILVDHARERRAVKRDGIKVSIDDEQIATIQISESLIDLDLALSELAEYDEQQAKIVEMRYFGGLTFDEIAAILDLSRTRVFREWTFARTWLYDKLLRN